MCHTEISEEAEDSSVVACLACPSHGLLLSSWHPSVLEEAYTQRARERLTDWEADWGLEFKKFEITWCLPLEANREVIIWGCLSVRISAFGFLHTMVQMPSAELCEVDTFSLWEP